MHWQMDVTFKEDCPLLRGKSALENFGVLKKYMLINLGRRAKKFNDYIPFAQCMFSGDVDGNYRDKVILGNA